MLTEILYILKSKTSYSTEQIAVELHTSTESILASLDYLEKLNYIKMQSLQSTKSSSCSKCSGCANNKAAPTARLWELV